MIVMYGNLDDLHRVGGGLDCSRQSGHLRTSGVYQLDESKTFRHQALEQTHDHGIYLQFPAILGVEPLLRS
jgi:hypothetical protein